MRNVITIIMKETHTHKQTHTLDSNKRAKWDDEKYGF